MAIKFEQVSPGDTLYDCHRTKMGNTTLSTMGCWDVHVFEVDTVKQSALVSWNGNPRAWWSRRQIEKLRRSCPKPRN